MLHRRVETEKQGRSWCQPLQWLQNQILTYNSVLNVGPSPKNDAGFF
jgi:hypothetical protein